MNTVTGSVPPSTDLSEQPAPWQQFLPALAHFFGRRLRYGWLFVLAFTLVVTTLVAWGDLWLREQQRLGQLQTEAQRSAYELSASTLNGNLMGAISLLGLIDRDIKQEASNGLLSEDAHIPITLSTLGNAFGAEGVFVVGSDGLIKTSWERSGKSSSGLDVGFRPYVRLALKGQPSVYAAVSMARGDRSLYFATPVYPETARSTVGVGAVVARIGLNGIDAMLKERFDTALLVSPQGMVFAATESQWIGSIDQPIDETRLKDLRALRQFGPALEKAPPVALMLPTQSGLHTMNGQPRAVAMSPVRWNDAAGDWKLVVMEDLEHSVPRVDAWWKAAVAALVCLILGGMWLHLLRGHRAQTLATEQLRAYSAAQESRAAFRNAMHGVLLRLQRAETLQTLGQEYLHSARELLGAPQGLVYVADTEQHDRYRLVAHTACATPAPPWLLPGEGVLGQCVLERQQRVESLAADGPWRLRSGLGQTAPAALLMAPLMLQEQVIGAVELALLHPPTPQTMEQFEALTQALTSSLEILRRHLELVRNQEAAPALPDDSGEPEDRL